MWGFGAEGFGVLLWGFVGCRIVIQGFGRLDVGPITETFKSFGNLDFVLIKV